MADGMNPSQDKYYLGSVVTMFPMENPKYTVMVCVAKQQTGSHPNYYGINLSGPTARAIMDYIYANDPTLHAHVEIPEEPYTARSIKAGNSDDVAEISRRLAAQHTSTDKGKEWSRAKVDSEGKSIVSGMEFEVGTVPNVEGMGLSDALYLLESVGMSVTHSGYGAVQSQSVKAGRKITNDNSTIHLTLKQ
jgi:cell division protein FtsI (penicillin-binding protein 3)